MKKRKEPKLGDVRYVVRENAVMFGYTSVNTPNTPVIIEYVLYEIRTILGDRENIKLFQWRDNNSTGVRSAITAVKPGHKSKKAAIKKYITTLKNGRRIKLRCSPNISTESIDHKLRIAEQILTKINRKG